MGKMPPWLFMYVHADRPGCGCILPESGNSIDPVQQARHVVGEGVHNNRGRSAGWELGLADSEGVICLV